MNKLFVAALLTLATLSADDSERLPISSREIPMEVLQEHAQKQKDEREAQKPAPARFLFSSIPSHPGALHYHMFASPWGDNIELEDGSRWSVNLIDRSYSCHWYPGDSLALTPNHAWFSNYSFRLSNRTLDESVEVQLSDRPYYNGIHTYWIQAIDYYNERLILNDGSVWSVPGLAENLYKDHWILNDTVIIGNNDGFLSSFYPNILINCETKPVTYIKACWQH